MQALQDMIDASAYQVDDSNNFFSTTGTTSTALQPTASFEQPRNLIASQCSNYDPGSSAGGQQFFSPTGTNPTPGPTVTPESTSETRTRGISGSTPSSGGGDSPDSGTNKIRKRQRNTEAARRYRQRKLDRVSELEEALEAMAKERDELKLKLAKAEAEAGVLRGLVGK